ncbi:ADP-ribosylglycohydrolase family protein [Demequina lutea]|uniref:ADP-ribosylglycohydrolase n=1 Tax=Demequina lutea TaxID=431489 RepID=A0A7Z0CL56_9MICO|nr:ADP-ribosylglycohydrolase family protein [Demequina lutea]NYI42583.1 ADP-ribosylglycohydrolase [Demequina lutea]
MTELSLEQRDRAAGAILGAALGDALGAPYEFSTSSPGVTLHGTADDFPGGGAHRWRPGEWTDDTSMAVPVLEAISDGDELTSDKTLDRIGVVWWAWAKDAKDVGVQTRRVLSEMARPSAVDLRISAYNVHRETGRSAGNGALMRTPPVALAYLAAPKGAARTAAAARAISCLTHYDSDAGDACVVWSLAVRSAILDGAVDWTAALAALPEARRPRWQQLVQEAGSAQPDAFPNNGWVVHAFQEAVSALASAGPTRSSWAQGMLTPYLATIEAVINAAGDTDTVATIAGSLAGALVGASALPEAWLDLLHGWPGIGASELESLTHAALVVTR